MRLCSACEWLPLMMEHRPGMRHVTPGCSDIWQVPNSWTFTSIPRWSSMPLPTTKFSKPLRLPPIVDIQSPSEVGGTHCFSLIYLDLLRHHYAGYSGCSGNCITIDMECKSRFFPELSLISKIHVLKQIFTNFYLLLFK
eukprot:UN02474